MNGLTINDMGIFCPPFDKQTVRDAHPTNLRSRVRIAHLYFDKPCRVRIAHLYFDKPCRVRIAHLYLRQAILPLRMLTIPRSRILAAISRLF